MRKLAKYNDTTVRIVCENGDTFIGACVWNPPEEGLSDFGVEEESLKIGEYVIFESFIREIELLRREICIPVRDWPEAKEEIVAWFQGRWAVPPEVCGASVIDCIGTESGIPQWYVVVREGRIIAGCGVIENDFHQRKDLTPNLCAVYVDEEFRNRGIAGFLLQFVCDDMAALGVDTLYLLTDQTGFYERFGWQFLCMARGNDGTLSRMYVHHAERK